MRKPWKWICGVLAVSLFLFWGCGNVSPQGQDGEEGSDWESYVLTSYDRGNLVETQEGIYKVNGSESSGYVYYAEKDSMEWLPLCSRADCTHTNEDCNACIGDKLGIYQNKLYYIQRNVMTGPSIWRMEMDGSNHEKVRDIPSESYITNEECFHKGFLIYYVSGTDEKGQIWTEARAASLEGDDQQYDVIERTAEGENSYYLFFPYEDRVYFTRSIVGENQENIVQGVWTLEGKETKILQENWKGITCLSGGEDCLYMTYSDDGVYRIDKETFEPARIMETPAPDGLTFTDGQYIYKAGIDALFGDLGVDELIIYDMEGQEVARLDFPEGVNPCYLAATSNGVLFYTQSMGWTGLPDYYIEKADIGTDKLEWKEMK